VASGTQGAKGWESLLYTTVRGGNELLSSHSGHFTSVERLHRCLAARTCSVPCSKTWLQKYLLLPGIDPQLSTTETATVRSLFVMFSLKMVERMQCV
jgi:hypothetical protein